MYPLSADELGLVRDAGRQLEDLPVELSLSGAGREGSQITVLGIVHADIEPQRWSVTPDWSSQVGEIGRTWCNFMGENEDAQGTYLPLWRVAGPNGINPQLREGQEIILFEDEGEPDDYFEVTATVVLAEDGWWIARPNWDTLIQRWVTNVSE